MLYKLNKDNKKEYKKVKRVTLAEIGWREKDLEDLISNNIVDFISSNDLMPIFTERTRQEEPDILAIDSNGDLYIFELKRWEGKQENLLQVLRYGQLFGNSTYDELNALYRKYQKNNQANLLKDHSLYFFKSENDTLTNDQFNQKQHFLIVTNGVDQNTIESIIYWKNNGLNLDAIVYWVFEIEEEHYIEFNMYSNTENFLVYESNCYILNTNKKSNEKYTEEMLSEHKAAAYYPGWREKIQKLQKGDIVFLYESGVGIRAYGKADGILNTKDCDGYKDYEYNMNLNNFKILDKAISASEIRETIKHGLNFRQTLFSISEEDAEAIKKYIKQQH